MRDYPETRVTYQGQTFASPGYRDVPRQYRLVTDDAAQAAALGFKKAPGGAGYGFERWVNAAEAERVVRRYAYAIYCGEQVAVLTEADGSYLVEAGQPLPDLEQLERSVYRGEVPASALERFWTEEQEEPRA